MDGERNGGEKPRVSEGAFRSKASLNPGYCTASRVNGSHSSTPSYVHNMSWPSQTTLNDIGRNTYQPKADAEGRSGQYRNARAGITPPTDLSARQGGLRLGTI